MACSDLEAEALVFHLSDLHSKVYLVRPSAELTGRHAAVGDPGRFIMAGCLPLQSTVLQRLGLGPRRRVAMAHHMSA